ncbi:MAG: GHMP kinase [Flavobacteriaceae bacterium]|nr:GHMP kinase [Flavobacteriaceae bacterium]
MIITKTPFRISFVGGGSDLPAYYEKQRGAVLSTSIDKYMYISTHAFFEKDKIRCKYSQTETVDDVKDLQHPILRTVLEDFNLNGIEVSSIADIPGGTGMGSSSSFTVGLLHNLSAYTGRSYEKKELGAGACRVEIDLLKEPIGKQDQYAAAFGGLNVIEFNPDGSVAVHPVRISTETRERLNTNLKLYYLGNQRSASAILAEQKKNTSQESKFQALTTMVGLVYELRDALEAGNLNDFGTLLHENWLLKQQLASGITNPRITEAYAAGRAAGALGGKLLGAGGGGFMLFYAPVTSHGSLDQAMKIIDAEPFSFNMETEGSKIIHVER